MNFPSDNIGFIPDIDRCDIINRIQNEYWPHIRAKGYFILIKPYIRPFEVDGIAIPESMRTEDGHHSVVCQVIDIGPIAYTDEKICGGLAWAEIGDWVVVPRVAGIRIARKIGQDDIIFRLIKEDDIVAVIHDPSEWEIRISQTRY